jgi:type IV secretion system protein VirB6
MNLGIHVGNTITASLDPASIGDFIFYELVSDDLNKLIKNFTTDFLSRSMTFAGLMALTLVTLWILITGYRVVTGTLREPLMSIVTGMAKVVIIISAATTMSVFGSDLQTFFTDDLNKVVNGIVTGNSSQTVAKVIDKNLAYTQLALSAIDAVQVTQEDNATQGDKTRALVMAGFGTAGPPMAAGAMLLLYTFAIAILIGIGPLFILFLMFDKTKDMFQRWLFYLIATLFSMAVLSVVVSMCLDMSLRVAGALWGAKIVNTILGNGPEGLSSQALQYGGVGLLLTVLIISVPPMMGTIFQGTVGNYLTYSVFGAEGARPGPQGQPVGMYGAAQSSTGRQAPPTIADAFSRTIGATFIPQTDDVKTSDTLPGSSQGTRS